MDGRLQELLELKVKQYNCPDFIESDPISIPHLFSKQADIEIAGFFAATFAWGQRVTIINKCRQLLERMDMAPHQFILHHQEKDLQRLLDFKHRTFQATDTLYFIAWLRHHYQQHDSLEAAFAQGVNRQATNTSGALSSFHDYFFSLPDAPQRTRKHVATPARNSSCKRLNMFLRWMVRNDRQGVDLGIWKKIKPSQLLCPLDVHVGRVARKLGLLERQQSDFKATIELTQQLKVFDPKDPVKYDFALFGLGVMEKY